MNNNKKEKIIGLIALGCVGVIVVAVVLWKVLGAGSEQINIQYGVPVDYEKEGFVTLGDYKNISISVGVSEEDVQEETNYHQDKCSYLNSIVVVPAKEETADEQDGTQNYYDSSQILFKAVHCYVVLSFFL